MIEYKGYIIEQNFYNKNEYTVYYEGDDLIFNTLKDAKEFIDSLEQNKHKALNKNDLVLF